MMVSCHQLNSVDVMEIGTACRDVTCVDKCILVVIFLLKLNVGVVVLLNFFYSYNSSSDSDLTDMSISIF